MSRTTTLHIGYVKNALLVMPICASLAAVSGCSLTRPQLPVIQSWSDAAEDQKMSDQLIRALQTDFPCDVRMVHRVVMTAVNRHFVFDGHLSVAADGGMRLIVMGPVGAIAVFETTAAGEITVGSRNERFPERWIRDYIARDLLLLFAAPDYDALRAGQLADGGSVLELPSRDGRDVRRYRFDDSGAALSALEVFRKGRSHYRAVCTRRVKFPGWDYALPAAFTVKARKYQLEVSVVTVERSSK
jgi:hypothetical protein